MAPFGAGDAERGVSVDGVLVPDGETGVIGAEASEMVNGLPIYDSGSKHYPAKQGNYANDKEIEYCKVWGMGFGGCGWLDG